MTEESVFVLKQFDLGWQLTKHLRQAEMNLRLTLIFALTHMSVKNLTVTSISPKPLSRPAGCGLF